MSTAITAKPKSEMTREELERHERDDIENGPLSVLHMAVKNNAQILISLRNNHKLLARVKAFDRHCNMVLENVKEMWTERPAAGKGVKRAAPINKDRFISKMFIRGDSVILVLRASGTSSAMRLRTVICQSGCLLVLATSARAQADARVMEATKADFFSFLATKQYILMGFYEEGDDESTAAIHGLNQFAASAAEDYPSMQLCKVNHQTNPYLTARMLLKTIPELRLLVKNIDGVWAAYNIEIDKGTDMVVEFMRSQHLRGQMSPPPALCTPFNICGRALGWFAEASIAFDRMLPIPRWLAILLLPALSAFIGRFIIDGMYATETRVRSAIGNPQDAADPPSTKKIN
ncbi:spliceosomal snRNP assembly [Coemansia sp. RSA 2704]|nr:spliceosomal snRNP assembly [Coemansia sp. RSA 2704]